MEERKLIKQGGGGFTIYLPKKWIDKKGLKEGDKVRVTETDKSIIIDGEMKGKKSIVIKLSRMTESLIRTMITNAYRKGYDSITVNFDEEKQFKILEKVVKTRLIGFDVVKKEAKSCLIENITEPSIDQFDNILSKVFLNIEELLNITKKRLVGEKTDDNYEEVEERIQNYDNFCRRTIYKTKVLNENSELFWSFMALLIHAQREVFMMNKNMNGKHGKKLLELFDELILFFSLVKKAYYSSDYNIASDVHDREKKAIYKEGYELLKKSPSNEIITVYHLLNALRMIYLASSPLIGMIHK